MKKLLFLLVIFLFMTVFKSMSPVAQIDMEDFFDSADEEFLKLKKQADEEFAELSKLDKDFAETLERAWKELELSTGIVPDKTPKPDKIPVARPAEIPEPKPAPAPMPEPIKPPEPKPAPEPLPPPEPSKEILPPPPPMPSEIQKQPRLPEKPGVPLSIDFYGTRFKVNSDNSLKVNLTGGITEKTISSFWSKISRSKYEELLGQLDIIRRQLVLNDWGYCLLLNTVSESIYSRSASERPLFIWFMLVKSGYDTRVGYYENQIYLLIPSQNMVYNVPFYELSNKKYYLTFLGTTQGQVKSLFTYEGSYESATKQIDFNMYSSPDFGKNLFEKEFSFQFTGNKFDLSVQVNRHIIDFYENYPQTNLDIYLRASITSETADSILEGLRPIVRNKPEDEAVNIILRFVQTAFEYQTDDVQFDREKFLFPEETIFYPYSDCEDRSIIFAFLVTRLLGLEVVGLDYPGHIATAVLFTGDVDGDSVVYKNKKHIICDPTYINANYGECMPQFKNVSPEIIPVDVNL